MLTKGFALLLVVLCIVPTTAPFSVALTPLPDADHSFASAGPDAVAPSLSDDNNDAIALERSTFLSQSRACACSTATHARRVTASNSLGAKAPVLDSIFRPPIFTVLRV
jgi:hypothetical protein